MARAKDWNRILLEAHDIYTTALDYDANNNPIYIGKALIGTAKSSSQWQIRKITYDGSNNPTDIQLANGDDSFAYIWDNRVSYSYS